MSSPTRLVARIVGFFCIGATLSLARPVDACSMVASSVRGVIGADGSVAYLSQLGDEERPGTYRWLHYAVEGTLVDDREITVPWADVSVSPVLTTEAGSLWLRVWCYRDKQPNHCNTLQEVMADGSFGQRVALPTPHMKLRVDGERIRYSTVEDGVLELRELDLEEGGSRRVRRLELGERYPIAGEDTSWGFGPDGGVVLAFDAGKTEVVLVRLDANAEEVARARYPRAQFGFEPVEEDGTRRLGPFGWWAIGDDGVIAVTQYANDASCHQHQPPSVSLFGPDLERLGVADIGELLGGLRRVGDKLVVLTDGGTIQHVALDSSLLDTWKPEAALADDPKGSWRGSWEAMLAAAAALEQGSPLAERVALFEAADGAKQAEIDAWWVDEGAQSFEALRDFHWQRLAARMCARHPVHGPAEALRRYDRSRGAARDRWLEAVVACFDRPIARVYEHAVAVAGDDTAQVDASIVFRAWGYSAEMLDALWAKVLETPLTRPTVVRTEAIELVEAFPQTAETFDQMLRSGSPTEQARVRQVLLETIYVWGQRYSYRKVSLQAVRSELLGWAQRWSISDSALAVTTGKLLRLGHRAAHEHAPGVFQQLVDDVMVAAHCEPLVWPWLALALDEAITDEETFALLHDDAVDWLVAASQEATPNPLGRFILDYGAPDPWGFVLDHGGDRSLRMLTAFAMTDHAQPAMRNRLLRELAGKPWRLDARAMKRLLEASWLTEKGVAATGLVVHLGSVAEHGGSLQQTLVRRLSELLGWIGSDARYGSGPDLYDDRFPIVHSPLIDALGREGVRAIHDQSNAPEHFLRLIARVGAWPEVAARIEPFLEGPASNVRVEAAAALAPSRHPKAFEFLLRHVEVVHRGEAEIETLRHYGEAARAALGPLLTAEHPSIRARARLVLRALGPREGEIERIAADATASFERGERPDSATLLMLHEAGRLIRGRSVFANLFMLLEADPSLRVASNGDPLHSDLSRALLNWLTTPEAASHAVPPALAEAAPFLATPNRQWLAALEAAFAER